MYEIALDLRQGLLKTGSSTPKPQFILEKKFKQSEDYNYGKINIFHSRRNRNLEPTW